MTAKAFAGASMSSEQHAKPDPKSKNDGTEYGAKGVLELWLNMGDDAWTSFDFRATRPSQRNFGAMALRLAHPALVSVGPELRYDKNIELGDGEWNGRAGLFVRYEWAGGEVSVAGGVSERVGDWRARTRRPTARSTCCFSISVWHANSCQPATGSGLWPGTQPMTGG